MGAWQLAHYNVALARGAVDSAVMAEFYAQVPDVNTAAERSPGYVWRLKEDGTPRADGSYLLSNLSVWQDAASLRNFSYRGIHGDAFRNRSQWFHKSDQPSVVLWWVPAGHEPDFAEADAKLSLLRARGASPEAFDLAHLFSAPDA